MTVNVRDWHNDKKPVSMVFYNNRELRQFIYDTYIVEPTTHTFAQYKIPGGKWMSPEKLYMLDLD